MNEKILLIEDDKAVQEVIAGNLALHGFDVACASDGIHGIQTTLQFEPDLIVCDISMPDMNGFQVVATIRQNPKTQTIPFIFLTALATMDDLRTGMQLGADDYLTKPVDIKQLVNAIRTRLDRHKKITASYESKIDDLKKAQEHDATTGLPKRALLEQQLYEISGLPAHGHLIVLMTAKIDQYRNITGILEQTACNLLIQTITERIRMAAPAEHNLYFLSDGKFALLITQPLDKSSLIPLAKRIQKSIRKPIHCAQHQLHLTASIGIASTIFIPEKIVMLLSEAELALHAAQDEGLNSIILYNVALKKQTIDILKLEDELFRALRNNAFELYYQPRVNAVTQKITSSEALLRLCNPEFAAVSPAKFIPLAEKNGLIIPIGEWVIQTIAKQIKSWLDAGLAPPPTAINISARQFKEQPLLDIITKLVESTPFHAGLLELELTESILVSDPQRTATLFREYKKSGIKLAIDDFGTGYSSLSYLKDLPFDTVKIDKTFIDNITRDDSAAAIVTGIIDMAHKLGVNVIAEGVEQQDQFHFLREHNCDEIQGYYFSKPLSTDIYAQLIRQRNL